MAADHDASDADWLNETYGVPAMHKTGHWLNDTFEGLAQQYEEGHPGPKITTIHFHIMIFSAGKLLVLRRRTDNSLTVHSQTLAFTNNQHLLTSHDEENDQATSPGKILSFIIDTMLGAGIRRDHLRDLQLFDFYYQAPIADLTLSSIGDNLSRTLDVSAIATVSECVLPPLLHRDEAPEYISASWHTPSHQILLSLTPDPLAGLATSCYSRYLDSIPSHITQALHPTYNTLQAAVKAVLVGCILTREAFLDARIEHLFICLRDANPDNGLFLIPVGPVGFGTRHEDWIEVGGKEYRIISWEKRGNFIFSVKNWNHLILARLVEDGIGGRVKVQWLDTHGERRNNVGCG